MKERTNKEINNDVVSKLLDVYRANQIDIKELENEIKKNGISNDGITNINNTFEMGYNNALEYVFKLLEIKF